MVGTAVIFLTIRAPRFRVIVIDLGADGFLGIAIHYQKKPPFFDRLVHLAVWLNRLGFGRIVW
jgi:hypothetical protein